MQEDIRIVLLGESGTGKSSLVSSLISDRFIDQVSPVISEFVISPEVTGEPVTTRVIDTSTDNTKETDLQISQADAIIVVYSVVDSNTFDDITVKWLPHIQKVRTSANEAGCPIILAGNKLDLCTVEYDLEEQILPITSQYEEVEQCFEVSAKNLVNIAELFSCAQHAVIHPTSPLYNSSTHKMTDACIQAFSRIFKLVDTDRDGLLNNIELSELQRRCFDKPLQIKEIEKVYEVVKSNVPDGIENNLLNEKGFLFLQLAYIQRGRCSTSWAILRSFGYTNDLILRDDLLNPKIDFEDSQTVELTAKGYQFLTELFLACDRDHDGSLSPNELENAFLTAPGCLWPKDVTDFAVTNSNNYITLQCFLSLWVLTTLLEPMKTINYLVYLGYPNDVLQAVKITRKKDVDIKKKKTSRNAFRCIVFGAKGSGKTSMLRALVRKPRCGKDNETIVKSNTQQYKDKLGPVQTMAINSFSVNGAEKYLALFEAPSNGKDLELILNPDLHEEYDVAAFLYDVNDPGSFEYSATLQAKLADVYMPSVFVASKTDLPVVEQLCNLQPDEYCEISSLQPALQLSVNGPQGEAHASNIDVFTDIISTAMKPHLHAIVMEEDEWRLRTVAQLLGTALLISCGGFVLYKALKK